MAKYILTKTQIHRLIDGKLVVDGRGIKYRASENMKEILKKIVELNAYERFDVVIENGTFDIVKNLIS